MPDSEYFLLRITRKSIETSLQKSFKIVKNLTTVNSVTFYKHISVYIPEIKQYYGG